MKHRIGGLTLTFCLILSLFACSAPPPEQSTLSGAVTEYSPTIAYAKKAMDGVEVTETAEGHLLKNQTAQLQFSMGSEELSALTSLQTGETLLKNTVTTRLTHESGRIAVISGGTEQVEQGRYGIGHHRMEGDLSLLATPEDATVLKEYPGATLTALKNKTASEETENGTKFTSKGDSRSQFGARYLNTDLQTHARYYLSVTLRSKDVSGLNVFFSTDTTPLTEDTNLGTLSLSDSETFQTFTAEISNPHWKGALQTLLFRFPEGQEGWVEISRVAILTADDTLDEKVADTLWTVYSDRIYFSQTLNFNEKTYTAATTEIAVNEKMCKEVLETDQSVGLKMIDGSLLGFVRPASGATMKVERSEGKIKILLSWDLSVEKPMLALRIYLNYTDKNDQLEQLAKEERNPLSAEDFTLSGAEFAGYDPRGGMYRLTRTGEAPTVTVKENDRTVYMFLAPAEGSSWVLCDKSGTRLPVFAGTTFPLCSEGKALTVTLKPEAVPQTLEYPAFFPASGMQELSRTSTVLNGLCAQNTVIYASADGSYTVTLTATRLKDGAGTIYDIRYDFLARKQVASLRSAFPIYSFELTYGFDRYSYLNDEGQPVEVPAGSEDYSYLGSTPYVTLSADTESAGWLITKGAMTVGGTTKTALPILRYAEVSEGNNNKLYLSFDEEEVSFVRGDTLTAQVIRLESDDRDALTALRDEGNFRLIQTQQRTDGTFTVLGMEQTTIVQMEGFDRYSFPSLQLNGKDFTPEYHVYVDEKGFYAFAFAAPTGSEITVK